MENNLEHFDANLCEKLFDFIYQDEKNMTRKEVQAELQHFNIDMRPAIAKLDMALNAFNERQKAQAKLKTARETRLTLLEKLKHFKMPNLPDMRDELQQIITQNLNLSQQPVYFRKLEKAASEQDLKTLLEDILLLKSLEQDSKDEKQQP
jgi:hypothetical protein